MKLLLSLLTLCLLLEFSQSSCTKEVAVPYTDTLVLSHVDTLFNKDTLYNKDTIYIAQPTSIYGLWIGNYDITVGQEAGRKDIHYSYELHKDQTIQMTGAGADGMTYYASGTWSLNGTAFWAHIITTNLSAAGTPQTVTGTYDSTNNKLSGIVSNDDARYPFQASFDMEKVQ
jgi:hypothetical protein